jgi:hypothetical protein
MATSALEGCDLVAGGAWGYFILNATMAQMCADSMMLAVATIVPAIVAYQGMRSDVHCGILLQICPTLCQIRPAPEFTSRVPYAHFADLVLDENDMPAF